MAQVKAKKTDPAEKLQETGASAYRAIKSLVDALSTAEPGSSPEWEDAREAIQQDALSLQVRSGWTSIGDKMVPVEYELLLSTGGPAVRIVGELDEHLEPETARLEVQDWFLPWTDYRDAEEDVLLEYARCFYFGEA